MEVINNTNQIKHLPINSVTLVPGKNDIDEKAFEANRGQPGLEQDIKSGKVEYEGQEKEEDSPKEEFVPDENVDYPVKTSENSPWYRLSNGEKVLGENNAKEQQEALDNGEELDG